MEKDYSVDDILLDIKSKKSRERQQSAPGSPRVPARETPEKEAAPREQFPRTGKEAGSFPSAPREREMPRPEPVDSGLDFKPRVNREQASPRLEPLSLDFPMSSGSRSPSDFTSKPSATREPARTKPEPSTFAYPADPEPPDTDGFELELPPEVEEDVRPVRNPLDFGGHVQPITDRAKMRGNRFAPPTAEEAPGEDGLEQTRVMPKLGPGQELNFGTLREVDFDGADDDDEYIIYDDDDDDEYEDHPPTPVDLGEYNSVHDRRVVAIDIARVKLWLLIRTLVTAALTGILFYLVLSGKYLLSLPPMIAPENDLRLFLMSITAVTALTALAGSSAVGGGLMGLFKMRANSDTLPALAILGTVGQCVFSTLRPELVKPEELTLYCCVAALSMLFNCLGKMSMIGRIQQNFKIISSDSPQKAVLLADSEEFGREFIKGSTRRPSVALSAHVDFLTDFLALSYSDKYDVGINRAVAPVCLFGAIVVGVLTYIFTQGDAMVAVCALTGILCVSATLSATFIENIPLSKLTKKLARQGGMVSGNKAVEDFCDTSAVVLNENDLFPSGCIKLHGIKAYSQGRVDEAILDAASVVCSLDSALSGVFLQMIGHNRKLLKQVDNVVYENGMGISAWVDSRRVLIGNRALMQNHGVSVPQTGFEQKYAQEQGEPIYLSNSGEVSAQFVVSYHIDEELAGELDRLAATGKTLVVYTVDPNLTPKKLWSLYSYPEALIRIVPAELHSQYRRMTAPKEEAAAEIAYIGKASAMVGAILACGQARSSILTATVVQLIQITLGYGAVALMAFMGIISRLSIVELCAYQLFWFIVIWLVQRLRSA